MEGVVYEVPVPSKVPPVATAYQFKVPALAVAPKVIIPASHRDPGVVEVITGVVFIVATTGILAKVQPPKEATT